MYRMKSFRWARTVHQIRLRLSSLNRLSTTVTTVLLKKTASLSLKCLRKSVSRTMMSSRCLNSNHREGWTALSQRSKWQRLNWTKDCLRILRHQKTRQDFKWPMKVPSARALEKFLTIWNQHSQTSSRLALKTTGLTSSSNSWWV